jgi:hypothetical protein
MKITKDMISKEALEDFKRIWKEEFGEDISDQKALESGIALLTLMNIVYRPIPKSWLEDQKIRDALPNTKEIRLLLDEPRMSEGEALRIREEMIRLVKLVNKNKKIEIKK